MRSNVCPLELVIWTAETKTGGAGQRMSRRMRSCLLAVFLTSRLVFQVERRPVVKSASHVAHGQPRGLRPWSLGSFKRAIWRSLVEGVGRVVVSKAGGARARVWRVTGVCVEGTVEGTTADEGADSCVRVRCSGDGRWAIITRIDRKVDLKPRAWPCPRQLALALALAGGSQSSSPQAGRLLCALQQEQGSHVICCCEDAEGRRSMRVRSAVCTWVGAEHEGCVDLYGSVWWCSCACSTLISSKCGVAAAARETLVTEYSRPLLRRQYV